MNDNSIELPELPIVRPDSIVQQVDALRAQGLSIKQACKELGRSSDTYYNARQATGKLYREHKSEAERRAIVAKVDQLHAQGVKVEEACKQVGVIDPTYYAWKNKLSGKASRPLRAAPIPTLDEKRSLVARVDALRASGLQTREACERAGGVKVYNYYRFAQQVRRSKHARVELQPAQPPEVATVVDSFYCPHCGLNQVHVHKAYQAVALGKALTNGEAKPHHAPRYCCRCGMDLLPAMKAMELSL